MNHTTPVNLEHTLRTAEQDGGVRVCRHIDVLNARLSTGLDLTAATSPQVQTAGGYARPRWTATVTAPLLLTMSLPSDYAERMGANGRDPDELSFILTILGGAATNTFVPTIVRARAGAAVATIAMSHARKGLTRSALLAAAPVAGTTVALTASPSNAELVEIIFRGKAFKPGDALQLVLTPNAALASIVDLYGVEMTYMAHAAFAEQKYRTPA